MLENLTPIENGQARNVLQYISPHLKMNLFSHKPAKFLGAFRMFRSLLVLLISYCFLGVLHAADGTWSASSGYWSVASNWSSNAIASGTGATMTFGSSSNTITLDADYTVGTMQVSKTGPNWNITLTGSSANRTLTLAMTSGTPTLNTENYYYGNFYLGNLTLSGSQGLLLNSGFNTIIFTSGLAWPTAGTLVINQASGNAGTYFAQGNNVLPSSMDINVVGTNKSPLLVLNGGMTQTTGALSSNSIPFYIAAYSGTAQGHFGNNLPIGTNVLGTTSAATLQIGNTNTSGTFNGVIGKSTSTDTSASAAAINLVKLGTGTETLTGGNVYTGYTTISGGALIVNGTHSGGSAYTVASGGTLGGTGVIAPVDTTGTNVMISIQSGGVFHPGSGGTGALTVNGASAASSLLVFASGGTATFDLGASMASGTSVIIGGASTADVKFNGTVFNFNDTTAGKLGGGQYVLFQGDSNTTYTGLTLDGNGKITSGASIGSGLSAYPNSYLQQGGNNIVLNVVLPPPNAPTGLTVTSTTGGVSLIWNVSAGASSYAVQRSTTSGSGYSSIATISGTSYTDRSFLPGTTYYYVVSASNPYGSSGNSNEVSASPIVASGTWTGSSGNYSDSSKWNGGAAANGIGAAFTFGSSSSTITLDTSITLGSINLAMANPNWGITFTGASASNTLTFAVASGTPSLSTANYYGGSFYLGNMTLSGTQGLKISTGYNTMTFKAGLSWTMTGTLLSDQSVGGTDLHQFYAQGNNVLPNQMDVNAVGNAAGTLLAINGATVQTIGALAGGTNFYVAAYSGSNGFHGGNNPSGTNVSGATTPATLQIGYTNSSGTFAGVIGQSFSGDTSVAAMGLNITKLGTGVETFTGSLCYTGSTTISGGALLINGTHMGGSIYSVATSGTLGGIGTIAPVGTINILDGAVLRPGVSVSGTLTLNGTASSSSILSFTGSGSVTFDLNSGLASSKIAIVGGSSSNDVTFNNTVLNFSDLTAGSLGGGAYVLFQGDSNTSYSGITTDGTGRITSGLSIGSGLSAYPSAYLQQVGNNIVLNIVLPQPSAPANVTAANGFNEVALSWTAATYATSYNIYRSTTNGSGYTQLASGVATTNFADTTAVIGTTYYYVVSAVNSSGESAMSAQTTGVSSALAVGVNFKTATAGAMALGDLAGAVRVGNWNNLTGPSGNGVTVSDSILADSNGAAVGAMNVSFTGGNMGSMFAVSGSFSNDQALFNGLCDQFDGTPGAITVTGIPYATYDVYFYRSNDGSARAGSFTISGTTYYVRGGLNNPASSGSGYVLSSDTNYGIGTDIVQGNYVKFTGLTSGSFTCNFTAVNAGDGVMRNKVVGFQIVCTAAQPPVSSAPAAPTLLFTAGNNQVFLGWSSVNTATTYYVKRSTDGVNWSTISTLTPFGTNNYLDATAVNGTTYYYKITVVNAAGQTDSSPITVQPFDPASVRAVGMTLTPDGTPGMAINDLGGIVRVPYWNNLLGLRIAGSPYSCTYVVDNTGTLIPGMNVTYTLGNGGGNFIGSQTNDILGNDVTLYANGVDQFNAGTPGAVTFNGIPYSSYDVYVYNFDNGSTHGGSVTVNGVTKYVRCGVGIPDNTGLGYIESTDTTYGNGTDIQQGNFVHFAAQSGSTCTIQLNAVNCGDGASQRFRPCAVQIVSNTLVSVTPPASAPTAPTGMAATGGNRVVNLSWNASSTATAYNIKRSASSGSGYSLIATVSAPQTRYCDISATNNNTSYYYVVTGTNSIGEGTASAEASATPSTPAFTPQDRSVYQWSVPVIPPVAKYAPTADPERRAYLWIPPGCSKVRGLVVDVQNMIEKGMMEDLSFRQACADANLGIVWISPGYATSITSGTLTPNGPNMCLTLDPALCDSLTPDTIPAGKTSSQEAADEMVAILNLLAAESGHSELQYAPIALTGHSAGSFICWIRPVYASGGLAGRVFAILPNRTMYPGSCPPNIPVLQCAEQWFDFGPIGDSWAGDRYTVTNFRGGSSESVSGTTNALIGEYTIPGVGHCHHDPRQMAPINLFIKKAAQYRIPSSFDGTSMPVLNNIDPTTGWLVDPTVTEPKWKEYGTLTPVSYAAWQTVGKDPKKAWWYLDQELAQSVCDAMNNGFGKKPQMLDAIYDNGSPGPLGPTNVGITPYYATVRNAPNGDPYFQLRATFLAQSPTRLMYHGDYLGFPGGPVYFEDASFGGIRQIGPDTFAYAPDRGGIPRQNQGYVIAYHPGDSVYRATDKPTQILNSIYNTSGSAQTLSFPTIPNQVATNLSQVILSATVTSGLPVKYWMISGPYKNYGADTSILLPDTAPAVAKYPMRAMVSAWQWGNPNSPQFQSVGPVYSTFWVFKDPIQKWKYETFGSTYTGSDGQTNWYPLPAYAGDAACPAGDGISNLMKYATGLSPSIPAKSPAIQGTTANGSRLTLSFNRIADPNLTYIVEGTSDLSAGWTQVWTSTGTSNIAGAVTVTDVLDITSQSKRFLRLRVLH